jgi:hypothetical protein
MKNILVFLLFFTCSLASATDYYISSSGNDKSDGLSSLTAWQTISKLNSVVSEFKPGDRILFKRGDIFHGSINIKCSGSENMPIVFGAYGTGPNPVISGFQLLAHGTPLEMESLNARLKLQAL